MYFYYYKLSYHIPKIINQTSWFKEVSEEARTIKIFKSDKSKIKTVMTTTANE